MTDHEIAIVGAGLIGAAAARHAALAGLDVVLIGPGEPADPTDHDGPFASHHDSGRITRHLDSSAVWAELAARSIAEYPSIAAASGSEFHHPVGVLWADRGPGGLDDLAWSSEQYDVAFEEITAGDDPRAVPWRFSDDHAVGFEPAPAGYIDPRRMVAAQRAAARAAGATTDDGVVEHLTRGHDDVTIHLRAGEEITAAQVIVATGAYTAFLLRSIVHLPIVPITAAVILGEVTPDVAAALHTMPAMIHRIGDGDYVDVYAVPPVQYPDGRWYIKLGAEVLPEVELRSSAAVNEWMAGAADEWQSHLRTSLRSVLPDIEFVSTAVKPCMYARTPTHFPFVDRIDDRLFVAAGGNGRAAKSADAIGSLVVSLTSAGRWVDALDHEVFRVPR